MCMQNLFEIKTPLIKGFSGVNEEPISVKLLFSRYNM